MVSTNPIDAFRIDRQSRLPSLTGLRFVAAAMVFAFHATYQAFFASPRVSTTLSALLFQGGWAGVSFFFLLSGFVLTWVARPTDTVTAFWRRRLVKIYPNYLVTTVVALLLLLLVAGTAVSTGDALATLLLVQAWSPRLETALAINPVAWSLSCELLFYLLFPVLLRAVLRIRPDRLWLWTGATVLAVAAMPTVARALPDQPLLPYAAEPVSAWAFWFLYLFPPVRLLEFVLGILLARLVLTGHRMPLRLGGAVTLALATYAVAGLFPLTYAYVAVMVVPLGLVIAAAAVTDTEERPRTWLAHPVLVWLGEISFAFYLWHPLVLDYGHRWLGGRSWPNAAALGVLGLLAGVTVLLSWLLHTLVERPMMRRFSVRRDPEPMPTPPVTVT
ncbi:acyltransferase [Micromonospora sp. R77]|uniref:acyltransferase family protein n=1 Tax=Micromonospora sp. R77 TaxID=2925836 RepID=UPI001F6054DD|nr:acyltransferase [Micromonospora sp. R77]MCI4063785.1 acyltransferase [Micromonospora sp. R77]